jgi:uncharacterized protein (UPF0548 family)
MFLLHRPTADQVARFIDESRALPLSYAPAGLVKAEATGFRVDEHVAVVGSGAASFPKAVAALTAWRHFALGWVELFPEAASIAPGTVVAVVIRHLGFWSLNGCRVLYSTGSPEGTGFGFAYGTLTNHAECGEELFEVSYDNDSNAVSYRIRAVSRPRAMLARLGYPYTRMLQARFRHDSVRAVQRAVDGR